jgi:hypothetical protein
VFLIFFLCYLIQKIRGDPSNPRESAFYPACFLNLKGQSSTTIVSATRSSKLGRKIVSSNNGKNHATNTPPLLAFQNCVAAMIAPVQQMSVARFF